MMRRLLVTCAAILVASAISIDAFAPASFTAKNVASQKSISPTRTSPSCRPLRMVDPTQLISETGDLISSFGSSDLISFSDQGQNLAGIFFQASLLPYLVFLYFLQFKGNRTPELGNFGFQYLLFFVLSTIPSGIISKSTYGVTLADCDWLHGGAEILLTITNVMIVLGFRSAMTKTPEEQDPSWKVKAAAMVSVAAFASACAFGTGLGFGAHSEFLFGLGGLPEDVTSSLPWVRSVVDRYG